MTIAELVADAVSRLTPAERRVADVVVADPQGVAFGTVAELATRSRTSGPTVVRFATKLGLQGFADLQAVAQTEIVDALRPATARIRERPPSDIVAQVLATDLDNVRATLEAVDGDAFRGAVSLLADRGRRVFVLAGEIARGAGIALGTQLDLVRAGVVVLGGSPARVARQIAELEPGDVVIVIEHRRYERWLLDVLARARGAGAEVVALTDRSLSPIATDARYVFVVAATGVGPFDSHTATMALVHALTAGVAARLRRSAAARLDAIEHSWSAGNELVDA
ncbi:MAG TPA: MurR/RpiR family transcriptional regulator [Acidimicrobiia bacterium]|nr:MurR/RpiR family transcriptional regulator [Acidimicrobiia bacterium]